MRPLEFERPLVHATIEDWERRDFADYWADAGVAPHEIVRLDWTSKQLYVRAVAKAHECTRFIESGTHEGDMVARILDAPTRILSAYSAEIDPGKFAVCKNRLAHDKRAVLWGGSSLEAFPVFAANAHDHDNDAPVLWFLDGHANGPQDPDPAHFPLSKELLGIFAGWGRTGDVVVIDDCRFFGVGLWPKLIDINRIVAGCGAVGEIESDLLRIEVL